MPDREIENYLRGHSFDDSHLYQQASGTQINADQVYFGEQAAFDRLFPATLDLNQWPVAREWDPLDLGVHRAAISSGNAVPPYVEREIDGDIRAALEHISTRGGTLIVVGDSTAGKTRSAYEGVIRCMGDRHLIRPETSTELVQLAGGIGGQSKVCLIWLDDLERFIGPSGLNSGLLSRLRRAGVAIVATIRSEQYRRLTKPANADDAHSVGMFQQIVDQSTSLNLSRRWSSTERERARESADPRIASALKHDEVFGVAECLAAGPMLRREWELAWGAEANPRGASLVAAAVDCARAGLDVPLPVGLLHDLHQTYLDRMGGDVLRPEQFDSALAWATRRRFGVTSLLVPSSAGKNLRAFEYLSDSISRDASAEAVPGEVWERVVAHSKQNVTLLFSIAYAAGQQGRADVEIRCWQGIADITKDGKTLLTLGVLLQGAGQVDEAAKQYRASAEVGHLDGLTHLGILELKRANQAEAERLFREAAENGDSHGALHLAYLLQDQKRFEEAEKWYRVARDHRQGVDTSTGLASILFDRGKVDEAEKLFRATIADGGHEALNHLGIMLATSGREEEAEEVWREAVSFGFADAAGNLARHAQGRNDWGGAEALWRKCVALGKMEARVNVAVCVGKQGRRSEAAELFEACIDDSIRGAELAYAHTLYLLRDYSAALHWGKRALESDEDGAAALLLAQLYSSTEQAGSGDGGDEAERWLQRAADNGNAIAQARLGRIFNDRRDWNEALKWYRLATQSDEVRVSCELGAVYGYLRDWDQANYWLTRAANEEGCAHAACHHGDILILQGRVEDGIERYRFAFDNGHAHSAERLETVYRLGKDFKSAAYWRRVVSAGGVRPRNSTKKQKRPRSQRSHRRRRN